MEEFREIFKPLISDSKNKGEHYEVTPVILERMMDALNEWWSDDGSVENWQDELLVEHRQRYLSAMHASAGKRPVCEER